jgi:predicted short-subunit dehydrogenase-like oxidoreductase (DUF2520 family)
MNNRKFGFVGAGNVGTTLGKYFAVHKLSVAGYFSGREENARAAANFTGSKAYTGLKHLVSDSDGIFVTTPDKMIASIWRELKDMDIAGKYICHCSGVLSSRIFDGAQERRAKAVSVHPLAAINDKRESYRHMQNVAFTVEGEREAAEAMKSLFASLGNPAEILATDQKEKYHAGAVFLTNFVVALAHSGTGLLLSCGLDEAFARQAWKHLFYANAQNVFADGPVQALTGPVERGDAETVRKHLDCLEEPARSLYRLLSQELLQVARMKNPERNYTELERELSI